MFVSRFAAVAVPVALLAAWVPASARDQHPGTKKAPELILQMGHTGEVRAVAFSPDGARVASGSADGTVKLWDARSGELLRTFPGHARGVSSVVFFPDGERLATIGGDRTARIWSLADGRELHALAGAGLVSALAVSPDGSRLATAERGLAGTEARETVVVWDPRLGARQQSLEVGGAVHSLAFNRDGSSVLAGGSRVEGGKSIAVLRSWDVRTGKPGSPLTINGPSLQSLAVSPGGTMVAAASADGSTWVWEAGTGQVRHHLGGLTRTVNAVAFSPDSRTIASAGEEGTIVLWDAFTGKLKRRIKARGSHTAFTSLAVSPDGSRIAGGTRDEEEVHGHDALSGGVDVWDARSGSLKWSQIGHGVAVNSVGLSPDGEMLATGGSDGPVRLWYLKSLEVGRLREPHSPPSRIGVPCVSFSPDRKLLANTRADDTVEIWDVRTGRLQDRLTGGMSHLGPVSFSPDGKQLACGGRLGDQVVILWDVPTRAVERRQLGPNQVFSLAFSPSGYFLAAGSNRGARVWDIRNGDERHSLDPYSSEAASVAYSPDGATLATAQGSLVTLWDARTGDRRHVLRGHTDDVSVVAFAPDGKTIATGGVDRIVRVWDTETGLPVAALAGHTGGVTSLVFASDGTLISGAEDGSVRYWDSRGNHLLVTLQLLPPREEGEFATHWIGFTPDGYYFGPPGDDQFLRWRVDGQIRTVAHFARPYNSKEPIRKVLVRR